MRIPAVTVIAAAGKAAAGMSRRFVDRYVDPRAVRSLVLVSARPTGGLRPGRSAAFAAHIVSSPRIGMRLESLGGDARDLIGAISRAMPRAATPARHGHGLRPDGRDTHARMPVRLFPDHIALPVSFDGPAKAPRLTATGSVPGGKETQKKPVWARAPRAEMVPEPVKTADSAPARSARPDAPSEASTQDAAPRDYRRLRPTLLRDTLRRRGGAGAALEVSLREKLRGPLRFDPSLARLHRSPVAADAARALGAQAFTIGRDVFFGEGRYEPTAMAGLELLAHELTHVGQQARLSGDRTRFFTASGGDGMEEEAQQTAARVRAMTQAPPFGAPPAHSEITRPAMQLARFEGGPSVSGEAATAPPMPAPSAGLGGAAAPDARKIADHVYDLMKRELLQGSRRGQSYQKG